MGKLALWGAVGGLGKGIQTNIEDERKRQGEVEAHEREMALRRYEAEEAAQRQQTGIAAQEGLQTQEIASREKIAGQEVGARKELQGTEIKAKKEEGAANRASAERIAGIRARATMAARSTGKKRWDFAAQKTDPTIDPKSGEIVPGKVVNVLRDTNRGLTFVQSGNRFLLPDVDPTTTKSAAASEVRKLLQNPEQADNFLATYKYLPAEFIASQSSSANWGGSSSMSTSAPVDSDETNEDDNIPAQ